VSGAEEWRRNRGELHSSSSSSSSSSSPSLPDPSPSTPVKIFECFSFTQENSKEFHFNGSASVSENALLLTPNLSDKVANIDFLFIAKCNYLLLGWLRLVHNTHVDQSNFLRYLFILRC
jgi:hypothetical protein